MLTPNNHADHPYGIRDLALLGCTRQQSLTLNLILIRLNYIG